MQAWIVYNQMNQRYQPKNNKMKTNETKSNLLQAIDTIPGLESLRALVERMPDAAEMKALDAAFKAEMDAETAAGLYDDFQAGLDLEIEAGFAAIAKPPPCTHAAPKAASVPRSTKSKPITIRIPRWLLAAIKVKALERGIPYQTLMIQELGLTVVGRS